MADIYDLVQQSLARSQGGRNQFYDPTADFVMQIPGMIKQQRDVQMVEDKSTISDIEKLITSASSEQALNNAQDTISNFNPSDASLSPAHKTLQNLISNKRSNFKRGKNSLSEVAGNLDVYEDYTEDEIRGWDIKKLKDEITRVADINDSLVASKQGGFKYGDSKVTIDRAGRAVGDYYGKLQSTMQALATEGKITDEEANAIFFGDFDKVKAESLTNSKAEITAARKNIDTYTKKYNDLLKDTDGVFYKRLIELGEIDEGTTTESALQSYKDAIEEQKLEKKFHVSKYNAWSRSPYASEEEKLEYHMGQLDVPDGGAKPGVEPGVSEEVEPETKVLVVPEASAILAKTPTTSSGKTIQNEIQGLTNELEEFGQTKAGQRLVTFDNIENEFKDLSIGDKKLANNERYRQYSHPASNPQAVKYKFGDPRINFKWDDEKKLLIPIGENNKRNVSKMGILSETVFTHYKNSNKEYEDLRKRWKAAKTELEEKPWYKTKGAHLGTTSENRVVLELEEEMKQMEMQLLKEYQNKANRYSTIYENHIKGKKSDYKNYKNKVAQLKYKTKEYNRREK